MDDKKFYNKFYRYYELLENNVIETFRYIEPTEDNMNVYSLEYTRLLQDICAEVENILHRISKDNEKYKKRIEEQQKAKKENKYVKPISINDLILYAKEYDKKIINYEVKLIRHFDDLTIIPLKQQERNMWWKDHNGVKHDRLNSFRTANLSNTIKALSALYLLIDILATKEINTEKYSDYLDSKLFKSNIHKKKACIDIGDIRLSVEDD